MTRRREAWSPDWTAFDAHVRRSVRGCWEWTGAIANTGYGRLNNRYAHRLSYERARGPIPDGLVIDHLCRNRACVNPDHLEVVTRYVNTMRGESRGAISVRSGRCIRDHEWTPENTYTRPDGGGRQCKACIRLRQGRRAAA